MKTKNKLLRLVTMSVFIAVGVVISPILRFEGMCPMAHFINIVCSVILGPFESLLCAVIIGIIRMTLMGIPPLALTGAVFGAFLSGVFYRISNGRLLFAVLGEIIGTGFIGSVVSYPVMTFLWGKEGLTLLFYVPSFVCGTLIGGSIAFAFLHKLSGSGLLSQLQQGLGSRVYKNNESIIGNAAAIGTFGVIAFVVVKVLAGIFEKTGIVLDCIAFVFLAGFIAAGVIYYIVNRKKERSKNASFTDNISR